MARIEISMEEYNSLKDKIRTLEKTNSEHLQEISALKEQTSILKDSLEEICDSSLTERIFRWGNIIKHFQKHAI